MGIDFDPRFRSLTAAVLGQLPDSELAWAVQQHVFMKIEKDPDRRGDILAALPSGVRAVYAAMIVDAEVQNGGFNQFFWNSAAMAEMALAGLRELGATDHADLLRRAMDTAVEHWADLAPYHLEGSVEAFSGSYREGLFNDVDARYYQLPNLEELVARAIRSDPERFCSA